MDRPLTSEMRSPTSHYISEDASVSFDLSSFVPVNSRFSICVALCVDRCYNSINLHNKPDFLKLLKCVMNLPIESSNN